MQDTSPALISFIRQLDPANVNDPNLTREADLIDGGFIDSFGLVELIAYVQKTFGVDLSGQDFYEGKMRTVSGLSEAIQQLSEDSTA